MEKARVAIEESTKKLSEITTQKSPSYVEAATHGVTVSDPGKNVTLGRGKPFPLRKTARVTIGPADPENDSYKDSKTTKETFLNFIKSV